MQLISDLELGVLVSEYTDTTVPRPAQPVEKSSFRGLQAHALFPSTQRCNPPLRIQNRHVYKKKVLWMKPSPSSAS